jgi:hypothetical protein
MRQDVSCILADERHESQPFLLQLNQHMTQGLAGWRPIRRDERPTRRSAGGTFNPLFVVADIR